MLLFGVAFYILYEAYQRFREPVRVASGAMLAVAAVGLVVNLIGMYLLRSGADKSLNVKGAYLEVLSDLLGSAGVLVAGGLIWWTGWSWVDPAFSVAIGLFILPRTWRLLGEALGVLLEGTPAGVDLQTVKDAMGRWPGVLAAYDVHAWAITSGKHLLSAHVLVAEGSERDRVLRELREMAQTRFGFQHVTLEVEVGTVHTEGISH
jgi:cobalt-zinc-cadmium efflux system protein